MFGAIVVYKDKSGNPKSLKLMLIILGFFWSAVCVVIVAIIRLLFDSLKVTTSVADYDIFVAPVVEETLKFTFIFVFWYLKTTRSTETSIELTDILLFGACFGIGYGLVEKFAVLLTNITQVNGVVILHKVLPPTFLHFFTSLIHSYNTFGISILRKNLIWSVALFFSAIALHMLFNFFMVSVEVSAIF